MVLFCSITGKFMATILLHFLHLGSVGFIHPPETSQNVPRPNKDPLLIFPRPKKDDLEEVCL